MKRVISGVLVLLILLTAMPITLFSVSAETGTGLLYGSDNSITRAEWLHNLAVIFDMSIDEDSEPDNYFSDIDDTNEYYSDIILNVEFGVINVEAGGKVYPKQKVNRDFAVSTLNYCMGYQSDQKEKYTFSDYAECSSPESACVSLERGWLKLIDGKFLPEKKITAEEIKSMLKDAVEVLNASGTKTDNNIYEFDDDVVVFPRGTTVKECGNGMIKVFDNSHSLIAKQRFAVFINDIPIVYTAESVQSKDNFKIIVTNGENDTTAFRKIDSSGSIDSSDMQFIAADDVELEIDEITNNSSKKIRRASGTTTVKKEINLAAKFADGLGKVKVNMTDIKVDYQISNDYAYVTLSGQTTINYGISASAESLFGVTPITLFTCNVGGIGSFDVTVELNFSGSLTGTVKGYLVAGVECRKGDRIRTIRSFRQNEYYCNAEASASAGLRIQLGVTKLPILRAYIYAEAGAKIKVKATGYGDNKPPKECVHFSAYLYAKYGAVASVSFMGWSTSATYNVDIFKESNSPIRIVHHYEDGKEVLVCTKGITQTTNYFTHGNSKYGGSGWSSANGAYGLTSTGDTFNLYDYSLDDDNNATITNYKGNSYSVYIPKEIDGYTVKFIGDSAFKNKKIAYVNIPNTVTEIGYNAFAYCTALRTVNIPDSVTSIGSSAFYECKALSEITIPDSVTEIGTSAFAYCSSLKSVKLSKSLNELGDTAFGDTAIKSIEIPKSLKTAHASGTWADEFGPFNNCKNLKTVTFENGTTTVVSNLFAGCSGLEDVSTPSTITEIGYNAFAYCTALRTVNISDSVTKISGYSFYKCSALSKVIIPDCVTEIGTGAFAYCSSLKSVKLSKSLNELGDTAFGDTAIESIEIPKSLKTAHSSGKFGPFNNCKNLKTVTFENGVTTVVSNLFEGCSGLEDISIPNTITEIGGYAFHNCTALKTVNIPDSVTSIGSRAFYECKALPKITIPDSVKEIGASAFAYCKALKEIVVPNSVNSIGQSAFQQCESLKKVILPDNIETIKDGTFQNCIMLNNIILPSSIKEIRRYAFANCSSLVSVQMPEGVEQIEEYAFLDCGALERIDIPQSVRYLGYSAFESCSSLSELNISDYSITEIQSGTFKDCTALKSVILPKGLTNVGYRAFMSDTALTKVTVPDSVVSIDSTAFSYPAKTTIYGSKGKYAETFANDGEFTFCNINTPCEGLALADGTEIITIDVGEKYLLKFECLPSDTTDIVTLKENGYKLSIIGHTLMANQEGDTTVTATASSGVKCEFKVHIRYPKEINIKNLPQKTTYMLGEKFDPTGMSIELIYFDGSKKDVDGYSISGFDSETEGGKIVTVTWKYTDGTKFSKGIRVNVIDTRPKLTGIFIKTLPIKTEYKLREKLDLKGLVVVGQYTDGSVSAITDYIVSGYNALKIGEQTITIKCNSFVTQFTVNVYRNDLECKHTYVNTVTLPTPTTRGYTTHKCSTCGYSYTDCYIEYGDINRDGSVDIVDLILLKKYIAKGDTEEIINFADLDLDGLVSATDLVILKKLLIGIH